MSGYYATRKEDKMTEPKKRLEKAYAMTIDELAKLEYKNLLALEWEQTYSDGAIVIVATVSKESGFPAEIKFLIDADEEEIKRFK